MITIFIRTLRYYDVAPVNHYALPPSVKMTYAVCVSLCVCMCVFHCVYLCDVSLIVCVFLCMFLSLCLVCVCLWFSHQVRRMYWGTAWAAPGSPTAGAGGAWSAHTAPCGQSSTWTPASRTIFTLDSRIPALGRTVCEQSRWPLQCSGLVTCDRLDGLQCCLYCRGLFTTSRIVYNVEDCY